MKIMKLPKSKGSVKDKYVGFTVTADYKVELEELAGELDVSLAELLRTAVTEYVLVVKNQIKESK